jgi:NADPH2:quinone reductase
MKTSVDACCVRLKTKAEDVAAIAPSVGRRTLSRTEDQVLIEVKAAAVNPSDIKAATGSMPYAVFPRTPGRDYAGVVIDGPPGDRQGGVRLLRRSRHPARRDARDASRC